MYPDHPSMLSAFSQVKHSLSALNWASSCLTTMKCKPKVYRPESLTLGNSVAKC